MKPIHSLFLLLLLSCSASKNNSSSDTSALEGVDLGKEHTALLATISSISQNEGEYTVKLKVRASRQGGATAPAIASNSEIDVVGTKIFLRSYKERTGNAFDKTFSEDDQVVVIVAKNLKDQRLSIQDIKSTKS